MIEFQCWFCGEGIDRDDVGAVIISVANLWRWSDNMRDEDDPSQDIYCHAECAKRHMVGFNMGLEPHIFGGND